jgi:hypothetical protein
MGWSGCAPAPPASDAGKGRQRQGARHVSDTRYRDRRDRHRYRQELVTPQEIVSAERRRHETSAPIVPEAQPPALGRPCKAAEPVTRQCRAARLGHDTTIIENTSLSGSSQSRKSGPASPFTSQAASARSGRFLSKVAMAETRSTSLTTKYSCQPGSPSSPGICAIIFHGLFCMPAIWRLESARAPISRCLQS